MGFNHFWIYWKCLFLLNNKLVLPVWCQTIYFIIWTSDTWDQCSWCLLKEHSCLCCTSFCLDVLLIVSIFSFWLLRWGLKVQQHLLYTVKTKQKQPSEKTCEEQTKAAFACWEHEAQCNESKTDVYMCCTWLPSPTLWVVLNLTALHHVNEALFIFCRIMGA